MTDALAKLMSKLLVEEIYKKQDEFNAPPPPPVWDDPHYRFLVQHGHSWFYVEPDRYINVPLLWFDENLTGGWRHFENIFYFEKESDLTLFVLRWC